MENVIKIAELITGAKHRDRTRMKNAMKVQDELRMKSEDWNGVDEIRKWRETRHGASSS